MGLVLVLNASTSDYFYVGDSSNGFTIQIFDNQRIPDFATGEVAEFHVDAGDDIDIKLNLVSQITTSEAHNHPPLKRGCYFTNDKKEAIYGLAGCLMNCKILSIESLCECIPFYAYDPNNNQSLTQCTLSHAECLERYRSKF